MNHASGIGPVAGKLIEKRKFVLSTQLDVLQTVVEMSVNAPFGNVDEIQNVVLRVPKRTFAVHHDAVGQFPDRRPVVVHGTRHGRPAET